MTDAATLTLTVEERDAIIAALTFHRMDGTNDALVTRLRALDLNP